MCFFPLFQPDFSAINDPRDRGTRYHPGIDLESTPGQDVVSVLDGKASRNIGKYEGVWVKGDIYTSRSLYVKPSDSIMNAGARGIPVQSGDVIGTALDITGKYPGITNHVHFELYLNKPWTLINPTPIIFGK